MAISEDPDLFTTAYQLYQKGDFRKAYTLLTVQQSKFPADCNRLYQWRICMAALLGDLELAESLLCTALDEGNFYSEARLRKDENLKQLQGRLVFEGLVKRNLKMLAEAQKSTLPGLALLEPVDYVREPLPLVLALHGNHSNDERIRGCWEFLTNEGWLVALPRSSQVEGNNEYHWNDLDIAEKEIKMHLDILASNYPLDLQRTVITGFSKGGQVAILAAIKKLIPVKGFLAVAPSIGDIAEFNRLIETSDCSGLRGYLLLGEEDAFCTPDAVKFQKLMSNRGIPCGIEIFPGVGHAFPPDSQEAIERALQFILEE